jgi:hypothetical protein
MTVVLRLRSLRWVGDALDALAVIGAELAKRIPDRAMIVVQLPLTSFFPKLRQWRLAATCCTTPQNASCGLPQFRSH